MESVQPQRLAARPELRENLPSFIASISPGTLTPANPSDSPLTQQTRPEVFEPKVVELYRRLFTVCYMVLCAPMKQGCCAG